MNPALRGLTVVAVSLTVAFAAQAQPPKKVSGADLVDFQVELLAEDPFAPANQVGGGPREFPRGKVVRLILTGTLKPHAYTYPMTQGAPDQRPPVILSIKYDLPAHVKPLWPVTETAPEWKIDRAKNGRLIGAVLAYKKSPFTFEQDLLIEPEAEPGPKVLKFAVVGQVCNDHGCYPLSYPLETALDIAATPPLALTAELQARLKETRPPLRVVPLPPGVADAAETANPTAPPAEKATTEVKRADTGLWPALLASMGAAIAMLFTPCVFPMIPITVSFFLKQSEKQHHNALLSAGVYSLTIIGVLTLAVLILGQIIVTLANNPWLNLGLAAVLIFFALSLFGMYEIELPTGLARFTSAHEGQGGYLGAIFMALTFTVTSFTCTGPFLGPLLVGAKEFQLSTVQLVLSALVYSATFAAPFFVLALFPRLLKALPKSGGWLNAVKVVMGYLELAAALKFLGNTDIALHPGNPWIFNYETVLCSWIVLSVFCGLYLLGLFRLPHDSPVESLSVPRMLLASIFIGFALYMAPALWRETPQGVFGRALVAFLPLDTKPRGLSGGGGGGDKHLAWFLDYDKAWQEAIRENKLIFIDFTGVNCTNCRANENNVFPLPQVRDELKKYVRVQLYNDFVPDPGLSASASEAQAEQNRAWQDNTFRNVTTPLYAILRPARDKPVLDGKLNGDILAVYADGYINDDQVEKFLAFVKGPQTGQVAQRRDRD